MVRIEKLSAEARRTMLADIRAGHVRADQAKPGTWVHDNDEDALNVLIDLERRRQEGEDIDVLLIGKARIFNDMREIVRQMVMGEKHDQEFPYFTRNDMGIWEHVDDKRCTIHLVIPDRDDSHE